MESYIEKEGKEFLTTRASLLLDGMFNWIGEKKEKSQE